jgi:hypothetical protein
MPVLCVEFLSPPDQTVDELLDECKRFHEQGQGGLMKFLG